MTGSLKLHFVESLVRGILLLSLPEPQGARRPMSIRRWNSILLLPAAWLMAAWPGSSQAQPNSLLDVPAQRLAAAVKPTPAELRWQQIPWELDLQEAVQMAKKEKRPIFFWAAGGRNRDGVPLERC